MHDADRRHHRPSSSYYPMDEDDKTLHCPIQQSNMRDPSSNTVVSFMGLIALFLLQTDLHVQGFSTVVSSSHQVPPQNHQRRSPPRQHWNLIRRSSFSCLFAANHNTPEDSDDDSSDGRPIDDALYNTNDGRWELSNDFDMFLNQCSIQSFLFLLNSLRDPQSALWMERFTEPVVFTTDEPHRKTTEQQQQQQPLTDETTSSSSSSASSGSSSIADIVDTSSRSKLLNYHGLGAMNTNRFPTWKSYFERLLAEPNGSYQVESPLQLAPSLVIDDYTVEIQPIHLCRRLLTIRRQIADEFIKDLSVISEMGDYTLESYWEALKKDELHRESLGKQASTHTESSSSAKIKIKAPTGNEPDQHHDGNNDHHATDEWRRHNLEFLDLPVSGHSSPSPLRKANFDLLTLITTQEAIHRVLNNDDIDSSSSNSSDNKHLRQAKNTEPEDWKNLSRRERRRRQRRLNRLNKVNTPVGATMTAHHHASNLKYLREFYMSRIPSHFVGSSHRHGRADAFMAELMAQVPTMKTLSSDDGEREDEAASLSLIDPTHIAQVILEARRKVALEWIEEARQVPDKHLELKRLELNMLMRQGHFGNDNSDGELSSSTETRVDDSSTATSSFEEALRDKSSQDTATSATAAAMEAAAAPIMPSTGSSPLPSSMESMAAEFADSIRERNKDIPSTQPTTSSSHVMKVKNLQAVEAAKTTTAATSPPDPPLAP